MADNSEFLRSYLEKLWHKTGFPFLVVDLDNGCIAATNHALHKLTGYQPDELYGRDWRMFFPEELHANLQAILSAQTMTTDNGCEVIGILKDGSSLSLVVVDAGWVEYLGRNLKLIVFRDRTFVEQQKHFIASLNWALRAYTKASAAIVASVSSQEMLQRICEGIAGEENYPLCWIGETTDSPDGQFRVLASAGKSIEEIQSLKISWRADSLNGQGAAGNAIRSGSLKIIPKIESFCGFDPWREWTRVNSYRSIVSIPLFGVGRWLGVLVIYSSKEHAFEEVTAELLEQLGEMISHGLRTLHQRELLEIESKRHLATQQRLTNAFSSIVSALVTAVEARDRYTAGHESRVAMLAVEMARELGWNEERVNAIRLAAMVHDIGKISIPSEILGKCAKLSAEEWQLMKMHPETGYTILKDIPFDWPIAEIVRQHHEKLDGSGYPLGLKGDEISVEARLLTVADMAEAMVWDRPYRGALPMEQVFEILRSESGIKLDACMVEVCMQVLRSKKVMLNMMSRETVAHLM